MRSRRREDHDPELFNRVAELEQRVMLLEARIRRDAAEARAVQTPAKRTASERPRPRCPGCLLELPKGKRGETCVWCGFVFAAMAPPARRKRTKPRRGASKAR